MDPKECSVSSCKSKAICRGWCHKHYNKWHRHGDPEWERPSRRTCSEPGCTGWVVGQGWCESHYARFVRTPKAKAARRKAKAKVMADRRCASCGVPLSPDRRVTAEFCSRGCKERERAKSGRLQEAALRSYYKRAYGLTWDEVEVMRGRGCDICGAANGEGRWGQLHIDHCHDTGRVRGVLCTYCNTGLGHFKDDPVRLAAAIAYLEAAPMT